jgi:hypothetical protein
LPEAGRWPLTLSRTHWLVLVAGLASIVLLSFYGFCNPGFIEHDCEHRYLPSVEMRFGFRGGHIAIPGHEYKPYALLEVDPSGPLGRAGFRSGDIPVNQHGGLLDFCGALRSAEEGHEPEIRVINSRGYDNNPRRSIRIPALPIEKGR